MILKQHLGPKPKLLLTGLEPSDDSFQRALTALEKNYNIQSRIIDALQDKLINLAPATDTAVSLRDTYMTIEAILGTLEQHKVNVNDNETIRKIVLRKFPERIRNSITTTKKLTLQLIRDRVNLIITNKEDVESIVGSSFALGPAADAPITTIITAQETAAFAVQTKQSQSNTNTGWKKFSKENKSCAYCQGEHYSTQCTKYSNSTERRDRLPERTCFSCLKQYHTSRYCRNKVPCFYCGKTAHHASLCPTKFGIFEPKAASTSEAINESPATKSTQNTPFKRSSPEPNTKKENKNEKRTVNLALNEKGTHLTVRTTIKNPITGTRMPVRLLLDCGSDSSYILESHAKNLGLQTISQKQLEVTVFLRDVAETVTADAVHLNLQSDANPSFTLPVLADTIQMLPFISTYDITQFRLDHPEHARKPFADPANHEQVGLLLGNDYLWHLLHTESKVQITETLFLLNSVFGWLIVGRAPKNKFDVSQSVVYTSVQRDISSLWTLDTIGIREPNYTQEREEELALSQFYENVKYNEKEHRYQVTWPWRTHPPKLPTNFHLAKGQLLSLIKRYASKPKYLTIVNEMFLQQIESGIIEEIPNAVPHENSHYLPFHLVIHEEKSTPVRIVYNGSARTRKTNNSINDCLLKGMNLLNDLLAILLRFRINPVAVVADIEKAFHQIEMQESERDYLRFLWIENTDNETSNTPLKTYRFRRVPFGIISSPFMLAATITFVLKSNKNKFTELLLENIYVDNLITSVPDSHTAIELFENARSTFHTASMNLRSWNTNSPDVRLSISENLRDEHETISILGIQWNRINDLLSIPAPTTPFSDVKLDMRNVLKSSAKVFDPLGWMAPVTIRAKIMLQEMHKKKYEWNKQLDEEETQSWSRLYQDLQNLTTIKVSRYLDSYEVDSRFQYHCFSDASKAAYAAVIYLRIATKDRINSHLLISKARVTPLKYVQDDQLSIPRLELIGALIATRLLATVRKALKLEEEGPAILYIDSKTVLHWLHTQRTLPTFVKNRVAEIRNTDNIEFRHVPGKENIADLPTRTSSTEELAHNDEWWHGPAWLTESKNCWPKKWSTKDTLVLDEIEPQQENTVLATVVHTKYSPFHIQVKDFNSYSRLIRITAYSVRFVRLVAGVRNPFHDQNITSFDYAKMIWIKAAQKNAFSEVFENLKQKRSQPLPIVRKLRLFIDDDNIMRCAGRFQNAPINDEAKYPIFLPKPTTERFTFLLVLHYHTTLKHAGATHTLAQLRLRFWFPRGRHQTYSVISKCMACTREMAKPYKQPENSELPKFRLDKTESPFTYVGIDLCGPFNVLQQKKYILLVTCLVTRGISFEDTDDLETPHIAAALRRIIARRGNPKFYLSDNMQQLLLIRKHIRESTCEPIQWKLLPEYSPWMGGVYERLMKLLKSSLYKTLRESPFCGPIQFRTIIAEIEATVNSRPLTYVDSEIGSSPLTPNHFLRIQYPTNIAGTPTIPSHPTDAGKKLMAIAKFMEESLRQFWDIWSKSYLQFLRERPATMSFLKKTAVTPPKVGDVVIIYEPLTKRATWKLGKIVSLIPSSDGIVRAASLKLGTGNVVVRPLRHLYYLELNEFTDQSSPESQNPSSSEPACGVEQSLDDSFEIDHISVTEEDVS